MSDDDLERMLHSQRRMRLFYRKLGGIILHYYPIAAATFISLTAFFRTILSTQGIFYHDDAVITMLDWAFYVSYAIVYIFLYLYLVTSSYYLGFCRLHRTVITYDLFGCLLLEYSTAPGYGRACHWCLVPVFLTGLILLTLYIYRIYVKRRNAHYPELPDYADE